MICGLMLPLSTGFPLIWPKARIMWTICHIIFSSISRLFYTFYFSRFFLENGSLGFGLDCVLFYSVRLLEYFKLSPSLSLVFLCFWSIDRDGADSTQLKRRSLLINITESPKPSIKLLYTLYYRLSIVYELNVYLGIS